MDIDILVAFVMGMFFGTFVGIFLIALVMIAGKDKRDDE